MKSVRNRSLETLLDLNGEVIVVADGPYWTKFVVKRVPVSKERPHGLHYSLTLHDADGERVLGFDNAHGVQEGSGLGQGRDSNTTIATAWEGCGTMSTRTPVRFWWIFGTQ